jgi:pyroglutamyl-peptidase
VKVLVSAFEPFGGRTVNASWELARRLPARLGRHSVRAVRLPVVYGASWPALGRAVAEFKPDAVVALGEAPGKTLRLERIAVNLRDGGADNSGRKAAGEPLADGAPSAYLSTLPLPRIEAALKRARVPAKLSLSAGTYLCNETFYFLMVSASAGAYRGGAGFVHVPRDAHRRWPDALKTLIRAL